MIVLHKIRSAHLHNSAYLLKDSKLSTLGLDEGDFVTECVQRRSIPLSKEARACDGDPGESLSWAIPNDRNTLIDNISHQK